MQLLKQKAGNLKHLLESKRQFCFGSYLEEICMRYAGCLQIV